MATLTQEASHAAPKPPAGAAPAPKAPPLEPAEKRGRGRPPGSTNKPKVEEPNLDAIEAAWQGLWIIIRLLAGLFGFETDVATLPSKEARDDAKVFVLIPGVSRLRFLQWIGAPVVLVKRIAQHFRRKQKKPPEVKTDGAAVRPLP